MIALAVLAADVAGTLDLQDVSEVRVRSTPPIGQGAPGPNTLPAKGIDLLTRPGATVLLNDRRWEYGLSYQASLILPDVELGFFPEVLQLGSAHVTWHDRFLRVTIGQDGTYGIENSAFLIPTVTPTPGQLTPPQTAAPAQAITFAYSRSYATAMLQFDHRTQGGIGVEYLVSGGLDDLSQSILPQQHGPVATAELDHQLTRTDQLVTAATARRVDFSDQPCFSGLTPVAGSSCQLSDQLAQITQEIRHKLWRTDTIMVGAGAAVAAVRFHPDDDYGVTFYPVGEASYTKTFGDKGKDEFALTGRYGPYVDIRTGIVLTTLQGEARFLDTISRYLTLHLSVSGGKSFPEDSPAAATIIRGDLTVDYHVSKRVDLSYGERWLWQEGQAAVGSLMSAYGLLAVTVRERTLQF